MNSEDIIRCRNCGGEFTGKYCSHCSQKHYEKEHLSVAHFFNQAFHEFTHYDGKFFKSLKYLVFQPGMLSDEYVQGRHKKYISPVSFFILLNLFFYLVGFKFIGLFNWSFSDLESNVPGAAASIQGKLASGITMEELQSRFTIARSPFVKIIFIFIIPLFALLVNLLLFLKKRTFVEHLIFSVHFYAFNLLFLSLGVLIIGLLSSFIGLLLGVGEPFFLKDPYFTYWITILMCAYLFFAVRRFYKLSNAYAALSVLPMVAMYIFCTFIVGKVLVFYMTVWSL